MMIVNSFNIVEIQLTGPLKIFIIGQQCSKFFVLLMFPTSVSQTPPRNTIDSRTGVFNLLSSRANLRLSYNPAGRIHCKLQNHYGYMKHHHRGMGGSPGDVGEVPMTQV